MDPPRVVHSRLIYENRWMQLHEDRTEAADGTPGVYAWAHKTPGAVIVALEDDHVWLVEQWRHVIGRRCWELPQGAQEGDPDASAEDVARAELAEETGLRAGRLEHLGRLYYAYGLLDQPFDVWRATDLVAGTASPEASEGDLRAARVPVSEVPAMLRDGRIVDAATVAAWHLARSSPAPR